MKPDILVKIIKFPSRKFVRTQPPQLGDKIEVHQADSGYGVIYKRTRCTIDVEYFVDNKRYTKRFSHLNHVPVMAKEQE